MVKLSFTVMSPPNDGKKGGDGTFLWEFPKKKMPLPPFLIGGTRDLVTIMRVSATIGKAPKW